jgi:Cu+-exporting ATPase
MDNEVAAAESLWLGARLPIESMSCATCAGRIEKALNRLGGVRAIVDLASDSAEVKYDPTTLSPERLAETKDAGYQVPHDRCELAIGGMSCATCVGRVEKALSGVPGVLKGEVNLASERAIVEGFAGTLRPADLVGAIQDAGYEAILLTGDEDRERQVQATEAAAGPA